MLLGFVRHQVLAEQAVVVHSEVLLNRVRKKLEYVQGCHRVSPVHIELALGDLDQLCLAETVLDEEASFSDRNSNNEDWQIRIRMEIV